MIITKLHILIIDCFCNANIDKIIEIYEEKKKNDEQLLTIIGLPYFTKNMEPFESKNKLLTRWFYY